MTNSVKIVHPLPSGLLPTVTQAASPDMMATYAALDQQSRKALRIAIRRMQSMLDKSESWRPAILSTPIAIPVRTQAHADLILQHLFKMGCDQYVHDTSSTPIQVIFVTKEGKLSFLFQSENQSATEYLNNKDHLHKIVDADKVLKTTSIKQIDELASAG